MTRSMALAASLIPILLTAGFTSMEEEGEEAAEGEEPVYRHVMDGSPLDVPTEGPDVTAAVETFHETGENPYVGESEALEEGEQIYQQTCAACHLPDGSGRIGPNFLDDRWNYEATETMKGRFEITYGGGAGSMQAFSDRLSQDEILKVLAYVEHLRAQAE